MILCLKGDELGKVIYLYFLSFSPKNTVKNLVLAIGCTSSHEPSISAESYLRGQRDLSPVTIRNYLSDLRSFIAWDETKSVKLTQVGFDLTQITTPTSRFAYLENH